MYAAGNLAFGDVATVQIEATNLEGKIGMATRVDEMRALVEELVASAHSRVEAAQSRVADEVARVAKGAEDAQGRAVEFAASKTSVDGFIRDLTEGRVRSAAEGSAQRSGAEAERRASTADFMNTVSMGVAGLRVDVSDMLSSLFGDRTASEDADRRARDDADRSRRADAEDAAKSRRDEVAQRSAAVAEELGGLAEERVLAEKVWLEGVEAVRGIEAALAAAEPVAAETAAEEQEVAEAAAETAAADEAHEAAPE